MNRLVLLTLTLTACNQWVRPTPPPASPRSIQDQWDAAVKIESSCDPFEDGGRAGIGTGVMVSDWQVLTALHVVDCQSAIAQIKVTTSTGQRYRFAPEKEWVLKSLKERDGIARIQLLSADTLSPRVRPPTLHEGPVVMDEPLYMQVTQPKQEERVMHATGWAYGGESYGGTTITYTGISESGNSGAALYDIEGAITSIHLGSSGEPARLKYGAVVTPDMVPHR